MNIEEELRFDFQALLNFQKNYGKGMAKALQIGIDGDSSDPDLAAFMLAIDVGIARKDKSLTQEQVEAKRDAILDGATISQVAEGVMAAFIRDQVPQEAQEKVKSKMRGSK